MIEKISNKIIKLNDAVIKGNRKIASKLSKGLIKYSDAVLDESIYFNFRNKTAPFHWLWINSYMNSLKKKSSDWPFKDPGLYIGAGGPGAGKSSLMSEIMWRLYVETGKGSYVNVKVEKPRLDLKTGRRFILNPIYEMSDFFDDKKIKVYPNQYNFASLQVDEAHRLWNRRYNMSGDYNKTFGGFMSYSVGVRHFIKYIFLWTQLEEVDTQLHSLGKHNLFEPRVDKGFDYEHWLQTGEWNYTILGWHVQFFEITASGNRIDKDYYYIKRTFDLDYFDSLNLQEELQAAKIDNKHTITKERI